jgi:hypothetical protein
MRESGRRDDWIGPTSITAPPRQQQELCGAESQFDWRLDLVQLT